ncbi:MAG: 16S rRNA processing protein RimM [Deltaproteobacteria bacterium]|nr:16S rRNA processing protein RimM [Deltaproteobacteria bacterium]
MAEDEADAAFIVLAVVGRPHGVGGAVRARPFSESDLLLESDALTLRLADGSARTTRVLHVHPTGKGMLVLKLEGVSTREDAESLTGLELGVPRSALPALEDGEFYLADLPGMSVLNAAGEALGRVDEVLSYPTIDCALVRLDGRRVEIPLCEPWLLDVDSTRRVIQVGDLQDLDHGAA